MILRAPLLPARVTVYHDRGLAGEDFGAILVHACRVEGDDGFVVADASDDALGGDGVAGEDRGHEPDVHAEEDDGDLGAGHLDAEDGGDEALPI